jgi:hypothetical protein
MKIEYQKRWRNEFQKNRWRTSQQYIMIDVKQLDDMQRLKLKRVNKLRSKLRRDGMLKLSRYGTMKLISNQDR